MLYGIWLLGEEDWIRHSDTKAILAFEDEAKAQSVAADNFGYVDYAEAKEDDWVEVRPLGVAVLASA